MRNFAILIPTVLCLSIGLGCEQSKQGLTESHGLLVEDVTGPTEDTAAAKAAPGTQSGGWTAPAAFVASCDEREEENAASEDPTIIRTCTYDGYQTVATGMPDYKGHYSWEYALYKLQDSTYTAIPNASLFNERRDDLLRQINQRIQAGYHALAEDPENDSCFEVKELTRLFNYNELGISFEEEQLVFHADFGKPDYCLVVGGTSVAFKLKEIAPYLQR